MDRITHRLLDAPPADVPVLAATDAPRFHWLVTLYAGDREAWSVVLAVNQTDIEPQHHIGVDHVILAVEQGIFVLERATAVPRTTISDATCAGWIDAAPGRPTLVAAEDDLLAFGDDGRLLWRTTFPDVIQDVVVDADRVTVEDMAGQRYCHDLATGEKL